jgi:hypothetical protein
MIIEKVTCFPNEGTPEVIPGNPQQGHLVRITTDSGAVIYERFTVQTPLPAVPITMTDKQFRAYAAQRLGSASAVGTVWKAAKDSTDPDVQYAFMAWSKAQTYDKADVAQLCSALVPTCMTSQQRTALLANWPEV